MTADGKIRSELARQLRGHLPHDAEEVAACNETRQWLEMAANPFEQAVRTHITAAAIVLDTANQILVHRHKRLGIWLQPGGHIEAGETAYDAASRETREETGIATHHPSQGPIIVHVDAHPGPKGHRHLDVRYLLLAGNDPATAPAPDETGEVDWWTLRTLQARADISLRRAAEAAIRMHTRR